MRHFAAVLLATPAAGHAVMYEPPTRGSLGVRIGGSACAGGVCNYYNDQAEIGCPQGCTTNTCCKPEQIAEPTIQDNDTRLRTWCLGDNPACVSAATPDKKVRTHPWRFPGSSGVHSPGGVAAGDPAGGLMPLPGYVPTAFGAKLGDDQAAMSPLLLKTVWVAGSTPEVGWAIAANHGGGYSYRLCPAKAPRAGQWPTEDCFQQTPLDFVGDTQWLQHDAFDPSNRTEIKATQTSTGTIPAGSQWRKNPIPGCTNGVTGFYAGSGCGTFQFDPPIPGVYGLGQGSCFGQASSLGYKKVAPCAVKYAERGLDISNTGIIDKVQIPKDLPPGDYVLGFRWDCEETPQVWGTLADIKIVADGKNSNPFVQGNGCEPCCEETRGFCAGCSACVNDTTGACARCWEQKSTRVLSGLMASEYMVSCLGSEGADGGAPTDKDWPQGAATPSKPWSPGCKKCWADKDACTSGLRP